MVSIFIDGKEGTTGLRIYDRLRALGKYNIIVLEDKDRKDIKKRKEAINSSDLVFLCLPDDAARESVSLVENDRTVVIDSSTAHRTDESWIYGLPELYDDKEIIRKAKRISVPGCHASGFIALLSPLVKKGYLDANLQISAVSLTGYSGGGKKMISDYEKGDRSKYLDAPRIYGLNQNHKHLPEMKKMTGLKREPIFVPIVSDYYSGMEVMIPLFSDQIKIDIQTLKKYYSEIYHGPVIRYSDNEEIGFMSAGYQSGYDSMEISIKGNDDRLILISRYDNLGKGASGAAIQCMNIVLGNKETEGLLIKEGNQ